MKLFNQFLIAILGIIVVLFFTPLRIAEAQSPCPYPGCFGGDATYDYFCDCSENFLITFEKFYIVNVGPQGVGYLAFEEGSMGI
jgi:hypothetical protein